MTKHETIGSVNTATIQLQRSPYQSDYSCSQEYTNGVAKSSTSITVAANHKTRSLLSMRNAEQDKGIKHGDNVNTKSKFLPLVIVHYEIPDTSGSPRTVWNSDDQYNTLGSQVKRTIRGNSLKKTEHKRGPRRTPLTANASQKGEQHVDKANKY